ncbi:MAG TPA: hypothetical protein VFT70_05575 [Nocardioides sp.]|nr:hypothetical protein [Nocardioides sp.]
MKRQSIVLAAVAALAVVFAFVAGLAVAGNGAPDRPGPAMMVGRSTDAPGWWGDGRGPATGQWSASMMDDLCPGWSVHRGAGPGEGWHRWMMGPRWDADR